MGRIERGYECKFRALLRQSNAAKVDSRVQRLLGRARRLAEQRRISHSQALVQIFRWLLTLVERWKRWIGRHSASTPSPLHTSSLPTGPPEFLCDSGLGGLARWLRAAGYEARWIPGIDDDELLQEAARGRAILVTTDSLLMERRVLRDGILRGIWVPPSLTMLEQLGAVLHELNLPVLPSRCMKCSGELQRVDKERMREQIPPKTYRWIDEYFVCQRCGKLFWHGTHWQRIRAQLELVREWKFPARFRQS